MFTVESYNTPSGQTLRYGKLVNLSADSNRTMIFIPGLGGSVKGALTLLNGVLPHYQTIYGPDLTGFGLNQTETPILDADLMVQNVLAFHQHLAETVPAQLTDVDLAAISLGAAIATHLLCRLNNEYSFDYKRFIAVAPAYKAHPASFPTSYLLKTILHRLLAGPQATTTLPYTMKDITSNPVILNDPHYQSWPDFQLGVDFLLKLKSFNQQAFKLTSQIRIPSLILVPGEDQICDANAMREACQRIAANAPAKYIDYPGLLHDLPLETACPQIAQDVLEWLFETAIPSQKMA